MQMKKKNNRSEISRKAWNILRSALLWARKGGVFKRRRLAMDISKFLHTLRHCNSTDAAAIRYHYREREFSFDDTPVFHIKMHRPSYLQWLPRIPCINPPQVDFDYDFNDDKDVNDLFYLGNIGEEARQSFLRNIEDQEEMTTAVACEDDGDGIDMKAEEFIAKFYWQIKLQRQISLLSVQ